MSYGKFHASCNIYKNCILTCNTHKKIYQTYEVQPFMYYIKNEKQECQELAKIYILNGERTRLN